MAKLDMDAINKKVQAVADSLSDAVPLSMFFPPEFMQEHTKCNAIKDFLEPFHFTTQEAFDTWCDKPDDAYVRENSDFASWNEMFRSAAVQFARKKLALMRENKWKAPKIPKGKSFASITIEARFSAR